MKKILLIISVFILSISSVKAETSNYLKEGEYLRKNQEDKRYKYEDELDIKYGEYSDYILYEENTHLDVPYYDYEIDKVYAYHKLYNIKTIQLVTVSGPISYQNLKVYDEKNEVEYNIDACEKCSDNNSYIAEGGYLTINLKRSIAPENIKVNIEVTNSSETPYLIAKFYRDNMTNNPVLKTTFYTPNTSFSFIKSWSQYQFDPTKEYYSKEKINSPLTHEEIGMKDVYRFREVYTFHYNLVENKNNTEKDPIIEEKEKSNSKKDISSSTITNSKEDLINFNDYKYIDIPNTKKNDFLYIISFIIKKFLSITFFI